MNTWVLWLCRTIVLALCERIHLALTTMALRHQLAVLARSATRSQCSPVARCVWVLLSMVWSRWQEAPHDRTTRHGPTLAPTRVAAPPAVVAWAEAARTACHRRGDAGAHTADEPGECPVGCTAHPGRTGKARRTGLTYDHCEPLRSTWFDGPVRRRRHGAPSCAIRPRRLSPEERMRSSPTVFRPRP